MNGIRFYQEFKNKRKGQSAGTVVAAFVCNGRFWSTGQLCYEALSGLFKRPNSVVCGGAVSLEYLREKCQHIREAEARTIHPSLLARLDQHEHPEGTHTIQKPPASISATSAFHNSVVNNSRI